jgi:hypothetical protein
MAGLVVAEPPPGQTGWLGGQPPCLAFSSSFFLDFFFKKIKIKRKKKKKKKM